MCGIVGVFKTAETSRPINESILTSMRDAMTHRGPDGAGLYLSPNGEIGLGHRRLSIIDLSDSASQPMKNEDGSLWIVFNGEIYNHVELRKELEAQGLRFKTDHSDTEVILKGYQAWGEAVLEKLRGMFAFAIWDDKEKKLWMARDRVGVKPLYFARREGLFFFASEIKSLFAYPGFPKELNEAALPDFLQFLVVPAPETLFKGVYKLPAGHHLRVTKGQEPRLTRYWQPFSGISKIEDRSEEEWTERVLSGLRESIKYRMVSDVNFGVFLSGGIDSSANTALMAEQMDRPVDSFSIGYQGDTPMNELAYARKVVERYKTRHHEVLIGEQDLLQFLPKLVYHQDEPIADPVCVPVYYVSKLARENNTIVCQVGEGADELFCGYPYWGMCLKAAPLAKLASAFPSAVGNAAFGALRAVWPEKPGSLRLLEMARRGAKKEPLFWGGAEAYQETAQARMLSKSFKDRIGGKTSSETIKKLRKEFEEDAPVGADELHWMSYLDLRLRLPELLLMRVDKMTMATSVESRVPFLDHEFLKIPLSAPLSMKYKNQELKHILKKAVEPILPREVIYRKKQGFAVPINDWFQRSLRAWSDKKIMDFCERTDIFDSAWMKTYLKTAPSKLTWFLLNFVLWHELWIEDKNLDIPLAN